MASDGSKLLAAGVEVILKDGVPRRLILDMEALVVIEEEIGSLAKYLEGLNRGFRGGVIHSTLAGLTAGLSHYRDDFGDPEFPKARVAGLMDFRKTKAYGVALDKAWVEGIPPPEKASARSKSSGQANGSPGESSTAEQPSTTAAAPVSSGA